MHPLSPEDIETMVCSEGTEYAVQVYPEGPVGFEDETEDARNKVVISHRAWPSMQSHAETGASGKTLSCPQAGIPTTVTADGSGGMEIVQGEGDDTVTLSAEAVETVGEHINVTRFKLQGYGFDGE